MHQSANWHLQDCFNRFVAPAYSPGLVLEVGSAGPPQSVAPARRVFEAAGWTYVGLDLEKAHNVDIFCSDPFKWPLDDDSFDVIVSGQMLEHNSMFWLTFLEMGRVLRPGGLMIHVVPSRGREHRFPQDCWRVYRDGMTALAEWSGLQCVETSTDWARVDWQHPRKPRTGKPGRFADSEWGDTIGVFKKPERWHPETAIGYMRYYLSRLESKSGGE